MRLTYDQICSVTVGAVRTWQDSDGMHFCKCTQKQVDAWRALSPVLGERAETTTGIRLDFHTNSKKISFDTSHGKKFELYINNIPRYKVNADEYRERGEAIAFTLDGALGEELEGDRRVTLIFPSHAIAVLKYVELDDSAYIKPHVFDKKLLFIGDSITQGWDSKYDSLSYAWRTTRFFNAESVIHGVGGGYFHETIFDHIDFKPDAVIIALGTNDFGHYPTLDVLREHAGKFLDLIKEEYADAQVFVLSPIWREVQKKGMGTFAQCRQVVIDEALRCGFNHIDGLSLCPPIPEFYADGNLHPDDLGFSVYADNLCRELVKYLK